MSAICGIIDFEKNSADFSTLRQMGRATVMRGGEKSCAYINGGVGLLCNMNAAESEATEQPLTVTLGGKSYTVLMDGELEHFKKRSAETALEYYLSFGKECFSKMDGDFALAICDEYRGEVILARSRGATKPLYCSFSDGRLAFCSEASGIFRFLTAGLRVDERKLKDHILSPPGKYGAGDLYLDVDEICDGQCVIFSKYYSNVYPCVSENFIKDTKCDIESIANAEKTDLRECLGEILFAFDYPQFDMYMPSAVALLRRAKRLEKAALRIAEGGVTYPDVYLRERCDRLSKLCGVRLFCESDEGTKRRNDIFKSLDKELAELLCTCDNALLDSIFGNGIAKGVRSEKLLENRIRMTGMLIQTEMLVRLYPILLCSENGIRTPYASRLSTI